MGWSLASYAQSQTVVQVVSAVDAAPLVGVTLQTVGEANTRGWLTDQAGKAYLTLTAPVTVRLSYVGYLTVEKEIMPATSPVIALGEDVLGLDEVVVTGSFTPTTRAQSLHAVKMLNADLIEARGAVNLADLLQTQLNLKVIQDDILGAQIVMRGITGPNVKILIDGVPLVNGSGGVFDLAQINMNNVARVEIVEGPLSVQYGTNALAGTINIITKKTQPNTRTLNTSAYYETVGQYNVDAAWAGGWKNVSLSVEGARNQFTGYSATGDRKEDWIPRTQYLAYAKLGTSFKDLKITASYNHLWQQSISRGTPASTFNSKTSKLSEVADDYYFNTKRINGALTVNGNLSGRSYLNVVNGVSTYWQGKRKYLQDVVDDFKWLSSEPSDHDTTRFLTFTSRGTYVYGNTKSTQGVYVTLGYEVSLNTAEGGKINDDAEADVNDYGIFTAVDVPIGTKFMVQPALRYAYSNKYNTKDIDFLGAGLPLLPSVNMKYNLRENLDVRVSYGHGYRTPSVRELYYEFINANHYIVGNTDLQPELGRNLNASATWRPAGGEGLTAAITPSVFYTSIENKIELVRITDRSTLPDDVSKDVPVARTYANIPHFKSMGVNLAAEIITTRGLHLSPGVGILARSGSQSHDHFYPSYEADLNASYLHKSSRIRYNLFYKYNGNMTQFAKEEDGSIGVLTLQDYHTLDISVSRTFMQSRLLVTVGGKNLCNVTDVATKGEGSKGLISSTGSDDNYPISWGRTAFIKVNYTIQ